MKSLLMGTLGFLVIALASCGGDDLESSVLPSDFNPDAINFDSKADSIFQPTQKGEIQQCDNVDGRLSERGGAFHLYTFNGKAGYRITFSLSTPAADEAGKDSPFFWPYLRVIAPNGEKKTAWRNNLSYADDLFVDLEWSLPEDGEYSIMVTSVGNMAWLGGVLGHMPGSAGNYSLEMECSRE